jgi:hypothetical protein
MRVKMIKDPELIMQNYITVYKKLHNRIPQELRAIDVEWVLVNGARIRLVELEYMTVQMNNEYEQLRSQKKNLVAKLVKWFTG